MNKRRSIILPPGTTIQGTASNTGLQVYEDQIMGLAVDNTNTSLVDVIAQFGNTSNPALVQVTCLTNAGAVSFLQQIQNYLASDSSPASGGFYPVVPAVLSFSNIDPTPYLTNQDFELQIMGTGFSASGINALKLDDGAGHVFTYPSITINSDNFMYAAMPINQFTVAGSYVGYYSTDGGSTWTTTGLTITVS